MPALGFYTPIAHDARARTLVSTPTFTSDANYQAGYRANAADNASYVAVLPLAGTVNMAAADAKTMYVTVEGGVSSDYNPGVIQHIALIASGAVGSTCKLEIQFQFVVVFQARATLTDENGTAHSTSWNNLTRNNYYGQLGASVKLYSSGGNTVVDVVLRVGGSDVQTLSADVISGTTKTLRFDTLSCGPTEAWGKGGTGTIYYGVAKVHGSSGCAVDTGTAWSQSDVDAVLARMTGTVSASEYAHGLLTAYDSSDTGDTWPSTTTEVVDYRLPTADGTPSQWTPSSGSDRYAMVDDALGSYSTADYNSVTAGQVQVYNYGDLSLSGKTVLCVGLQDILTAATGGFQDGTGAYSAQKTLDTATSLAWWHLKPTLTTPAAGSVQVCMF